MRHEQHTIPLPSPIANGNGAPVPIHNLTQVFVEVYGGTRSYTIEIQYSLDGISWQQLVAPAAGAIFEPLDTTLGFPIPAAYLRAVVASFVSETAAPTCILVGRNIRTV